MLKPNQKWNLVFNPSCHLWKLYPSRKGQECPINHTIVIIPKGSSSNKYNKKLHKSRAGYNKGTQMYHFKHTHAHSHSHFILFYFMFIFLSFGLLSRGFIQCVKVCYLSDLILTIVFELELGLLLLRETELKEKYTAQRVRQASNLNCELIQSIILELIKGHFTV